MPETAPPLRDDEDDPEYVDLGLDEPLEIDKPDAPDDVKIPAEGAPTPDSERRRSMMIDGFTTVSTGTNGVVPPERNSPNA